MKNLLNPKPFSSRYTNHGLKYEPVALEQYQKYMMSIRRPVKILKSGLVISLDSPYLGASPDAKVIDPGCDDPFGLSEVKCPETKYLVTPLDACSDSNFFMEEEYFLGLIGVHEFFSISFPLARRFFLYFARPRS